MLYAESNYKSVPDLLAAFAPEFKTQHFHIHGGAHHNSKEDALLSVIQDDTNQLHQGARLALKGAAFGLVSAFFYNAQYGGKENEFLHTRSVLNKAGKTKSLTPLTIYGTLAGLSWWVINELFLNSHGKESSYQRYLLAHSFQGGLMLATLYHPAAFGYGLIAGGAFGRLPKNFQLYFKNFDEEKRRNKLREDEEYELSLRSVLRTPNRVFHPI